MVRPQAFLRTIFLAALTLSTIMAIGGESPAGPWKPIKDVHDPQVQFIAEVAVSSYSEEQHRYVILKDVVRGEIGDSRIFTKYLLHLVVNQTWSPCFKTMVLDRKKHPHYREVSFFESEIC